MRPPIKSPCKQIRAHCVKGIVALIPLVGMAEPRSVKTVDECKNDNDLAKESARLVTSHCQADYENHPRREKPALNVYQPNITRLELYPS